MSPHEAAERLLAEHLAAQECGLLHDEPTTAERNRVAAEIASEAGKAPASGTIPGPSGPARPRRRLKVALAVAAAVLLLGLGTWALVPPLPRPDAKEDGSLGALLDGQGRVVPVSEQTRFTIVDAARGQVRLEQGEVYVELRPGTGLRATVETPAGTATALGTRFYAHYHGAPQPQAVASPATGFLAVVVLAGMVEVRNPHGRAIGDVGEVVLAASASAPEKHADYDHALCPLANSLRLVYLPQVQVELNLTDEQKARLQRPEQDEQQEICNFFRSLQALPRPDRSRKATEFCRLQQQKVGAVLVPVQQGRLRQIRSQQESFFALARKEIADELELTEKQRQQLAAILQQFGEVHRTVLGKGPSEDAGKQLAQHRQQALAQLSLLLTEAQKDRWQQLTGKPFVLQGWPHGGRQD